MFQLFHFAGGRTDPLNEQLAREGSVDERFIVGEIKRFRNSRKYREMVTGLKYYRGEQEILEKKRMAIGEDGKLFEVTHLPNNKIVDNQYRKMVDQKANYLVGLPIAIQCDNEVFSEKLRPLLLSKSFLRILKNITLDALNCGIAWLYPYYDQKGKLKFKRFSPLEIIPEWSDADHTQMDAFIRVYQIPYYDNDGKETIIDRVEVYNPDGVYYYELKEDRLIPAAPFYSHYFTRLTERGEMGFDWDQIPLVAFKRNSAEQPLIMSCKAAQDGLNKIESVWEDRMEEDVHNTILVVVNYDGQDLGELRKNLATYGMIKVRSMDGANGDVRSLEIEVNADNFQKIIQQFRKTIVENCMGYDARDDRPGSNPNEMNLQSMYTDIELDSKGMIAEYQSAFEELIWFIVCHLANTGEGDFEGENVEIIFNPDIMINESVAIENCRKSVGLISDETIVANHPWINDVAAEKERIKKQRQEQENLYGDFGAGQ